MLKVELIYDLDCPNVDDARAQLTKAFAAVKIAPQWQEWDRNDPQSPKYVLKYGSPTILINGKDIDNDPQGQEANCCRVYTSENKKLTGIPPLEMIVSALSK